MNLDFEDLFRHSFVLTIDFERFRLFSELMHYSGFPIPRIFCGTRETDRCKDGTNESELRIIEYARDMDWPYVLIFEDDAFPSRNAVGKFRNYLQGVPDDADFLQFSWTNNFNELGSKFNRMAMPAFCTACYICFNSGYRRFERGLAPGKDRLNQYSAVDCLQPTMTSYLTQEPVFIQYNFNQTVNGNSGYDISYDKTLRQPGYFDKNFFRIGKMADDERLSRTDPRLYSVLSGR